MTAHISFRTPFRARTIWVHPGARFTHWPDSLEHGPDSEAAPTTWLVYAPFREEKRKILNSSSTPPSMGQQNEPQDAHPECAHTGHDYFHRWPHVNWTLRLPCSAKRELSPHDEHRYARSLITYTHITYMTNTAITRLPPGVPVSATAPAYEPHLLLAPPGTSPNGLRRSIRHAPTPTSAIPAMASALRSQ